MVGRLRKDYGHRLGPVYELFIITGIFLISHFAVVKQEDFIANVRLQTAALLQLLRFHMRPYISQLKLMLRAEYLVILVIKGPINIPVSRSSVLRICSVHSSKLSSEK